MSLESKPDTMQSKMLEDVDRFLTESSYTDDTSRSYSYHLFRLANWMYDCGLEPNDLTASLLKTYLKAQNWSNNTQRAAGNAAKSFLRWRYGATHQALTLKLPRDNAAPGRWLNQEQVDALLASFDTTQPVGWRNIAMIALMVESGIREAEVCGLEMNHLHLADQRFNVLAKGEKWRKGVFSKITAYYLDVWLNSRSTYALHGVSTVFVSVNGKTKGSHMTPAGLRANFRHYGQRVGLVEKLSPHDLRRTMAMLLTKAGAPTRLVQELGGWEDIRMVERYTRSLEADQIELYSPLVQR